jgi:Mycothiol maleylpyruvate isomerase N-terminal domain
MVRFVITADDLRKSVADAVAALETVVDTDWDVRALDSEWDCRETIDHIADDLFAYAVQLGPRPTPQESYLPFAYTIKHEGGPALSVWADPAAGNPGSIQVLAAAGALLAAMVQTSPPELRAFHPFGLADPEGWAAIGLVELIVHMRDVAGALGAAWRPDEDLCGRILDRVFAPAPLPDGGSRWDTLLWATGRASWDGAPKLEKWRWWCAPLDEQVA